MLTVSYENKRFILSPFPLVCFVHNKNMEGLSGITIQRVTETSDLDTLHAQDPFLCLKCGARVFPASNVGTWGCSTHPRLFVRGLERYACCNREYGSGGCVPCDHVRMHGDLQMLFVINKEFLGLKNGFKIEEPLSQAIPASSWYIDHPRRSASLPHQT
mgnify:CR=1 FL=1